MKAKTARKVRNLLLIIGLAMMALGSASESVSIAGRIAAISSLIPHFLFNKCPHCGKQLGRNEEDTCQHCGKTIG